MHLNKIGLLAFSCGAIFMANSCNQTKTLSYEAAKKWVSEHYTKSGKTSPLKSGKAVFNYSKTKGERATKIAKQTIFNYSGEEGNLKGTHVYTEEELSALSEDNEYFNVEQLPSEQAVETHNIVFTVTNGSFAYSKTDDVSKKISYPYSTGLFIYTYKYDKEGAPISTSTKHKNVKFVGSNEELLDGSITVTMSY